MNTIKSRHSRSGDVNLRPISEIPAGLEVIKHDGSYITARGEATGSTHILKVKNKSNMVLMKDGDGNVYVQLLSDATHSHTKDHETIIVKPGIYKQIQEREIDWFADGVTRKVLD